MLPQNEIFCIFIDSGCMATMGTVNFLQAKNQAFILTVKPNIYSVLFEYLDYKLEVWNFNTLSNGNFEGISWKCVGTFGQKTIVRWMTNLANMHEQEVDKVQDGKLNMRVDQNVPSCRKIWNKFHGKVN